MNVLSLFDGISCGRVALERVGIPIENYFASEIDKYAMQIAMKNYPDTQQLGSVTMISAYDLPPIDLLMGGSPCQGFSMAGNRLNFDDPRSVLFFEYVRILSEARDVNPDLKFLLENVRMDKKSRAIITETIGVEPIEINSSLVSAQNRQRLYWTNIPYNGPPEDKGIMLKDIILQGDENVVAVFGAAQRGRNIVDGKRKDYKGAPTEQRIEVNGTEKSNCLTSVQKDTLIVEVIEQAEPIMVSNVYGGFGEETPRIHEDKSVTLRTAAGGGHIPSLILTDKAIDYMCRERNGKPRFEYHTNPLEGKAACLTANMFKGVPYGVIKELLRRLHPIECERLQTLPDNYTEGISNTQRYKALGNGWTVDVIAHIFKGLL